MIGPESALSLLQRSYESAQEYGLTFACCFWPHRLHAELAELKQLVLGLLGQQNVQQLPPTALNVLKQQEVPHDLVEVIEQQRAVAKASTKAAVPTKPCTEQQEDGTQSNCSSNGCLQYPTIQQTDPQTERPKPSVQLELPSDECALGPLQRQLQQQAPVPVPALVAPVMLTSKLFKPSISDIVMHLRAAQQAQVSNHCIIYLTCSSLC